MANTAAATYSRTLHRKKTPAETIKEIDDEARRKAAIAAGLVPEEDAPGADRSDGSDVESEDDNDKDRDKEENICAEHHSSDEIIAPPQPPQCGRSTEPWTAAQRKYDGHLRGGGETLEIVAEDTASVFSDGSRNLDTVMIWGKQYVRYRDANGKVKVAEAKTRKKRSAPETKTPSTPKATPKKTTAVRPESGRRQSVPAPASSSTSSSAKSTSKGAASVKSKAPERRHSMMSSLLGGSPKKSTKAAPKIEMVECTTCLDEVAKDKGAFLPCKHYMCRPCLIRLFKLSMTDQSLMPPKCCNQELSIRYVNRRFSDEWKEKWWQKYDEYKTKLPLYCFKKGCGAWIPPEKIKLDKRTGRRKGTCKECKTEVCKSCSQRWHSGRKCEPDDGTREVLSLGEEEGWKRCPGCRAMVQRSEGCNHMQCRCGAEFYMSCGEKWKTCDCLWFDVPPDTRGAFGLPPGVHADDFQMPGGFSGPRDIVEISVEWDDGRRRFDERSWSRREGRRTRYTFGDELPPPPPPPPLSPGAGQEANDEAFARQLWEQEIAGVGDLSIHDRSADGERRRRRRARRSAQDYILVTEANV